LPGPSLLVKAPILSNIRMLRTANAAADPSVLGMNDDRTMGFGNGSTGNGRMPDGYLEAGFPKPGSLERAVREKRSGMSCLQ